MATVTIYFNYVGFPDVNEVYIARSTTLKNEYDWEIALNGSSSSSYDIISVSAASSLQTGTYMVQDTNTTDNQQYWYCCATSGLGASAGYRVGTGATPSTTNVTTSTTLGSSSVASVIAGSGTSSGTLTGGGGGTSTALVNTLDESYIKYVDENYNIISRNSFQNEGYTDAQITGMFNAYESAWNFMSQMVGLPTNGQTITSFLYIMAGTLDLSPARASFQTQSLYTASGSNTKTFGDTFPSVGLIIINAAYYVDSDYQDTNYWFDTMKHEAAHALGFATDIMFPQSSSYALDTNHNRMVEYTGDTKDLSGGGVIGSQKKYYWTGANALREYRALGSSSYLGVPMEDALGWQSPINAHWKGGYLFYNPESYVTINGIQHPVLNREALTSQSEAPGTRMPMSRITAGYLDDMGWTVDYTNVDVYNTFAPLYD